MKPIRTKMACLAIVITILLAGIVAAGQAEKTTITIDPIGTHIIGDLLIISGSTTLPRDSGLMVTIIPTETCSGLCSGSGMDSLVRSGTWGKNTWSVAADTSNYGSGTYEVNVTNTLSNTLTDFRYGDTSATMEFNMIGEAVSEVDRPVSANMENRYITVDPIGTKHVGDMFLVDGTTNLPAGTDILWEIGPDGSIASPENPAHPNMGIMANSMVLPGEDSNRISCAINTWDFKPGVYKVSCSTSKGDLMKGDWIKGDVSGVETVTVF